MNEVYSLADIEDSYPFIRDQVEYSSKLWHGVFSCRVVFSKKTPHPLIWQWLGSIFGAHNISHRVLYRLKLSERPSLFLTDVEHIKSALEYFKNNIILVSIPDSLHSVELLKLNPIFRIRKELYFKQYKHKVCLDGIKIRRENKLEEIKNWVIEIFKLPGQPETKPSWLDIYTPVKNMAARDHKIWLRWDQRNPTMFFKNDDDLILTKLSWGEYFDSIETAVISA